MNKFTLMFLLFVTLPIYAQTNVTCYPGGVYERMDLYDVRDLNVQTEGYYYFNSPGGYEYYVPANQCYVTVEH